jgi:hypothetical protein
MAAELKLVEGKDVNSDRQKALDAALAQIDRAFGKGSAMKLGSRQTMEVEAISSGSLGLDIALGIGGLPRGRVIEIYGPESSARRRWRSMPSPKRRRSAVPPLSSMPNMHSIPSMRRSWASISTS